MPTLEEQLEVYKVQQLTFYINMSVALRHSYYIFKVDKPEILADRLLCLLKLLANSQFGSLQLFTVCQIEDLPSFPRSMHL